MAILKQIAFGAAMTQKLKRILLIEDSRTEGLFVQTVLAESPLSCQIDWVRTLDEGLEKLRVTDYQAVLSDLLLPDSSGLETVYKLRRENHDVPIIVMTGMADRRLEITVISQGATDYLRKAETTPFKLTRTLERAIDNATQRQQAECVIRNLTEELQAKTEVIDRQRELLDKKNRHLRELYQTAHHFVDNLSSELRTPLNVIKDYVSMVREELAGPVNDEQRRMLDVAGVRTDDLHNMINDLLDVSKLEMGMVSAWRRCCRLEDVLNQVCPTILRKTAVKDIRVELDFAGEFPDLYCDAEMIGRTIMNLVASALKSQGAAGRLRIWARPNLPAGEILVGVENYGVGIISEELNSMFEQFDEASPEPRFSNQASGLGLSIAKELAALNYGTMHVVSQPGVSSNYWFSVPVYDPLLVFERYLTHQASRQPGLTLSIIQCSIPAATSEAETGDMDSFIQRLLRRQDIVFRTHENKWTLAVAVPVDELSLFNKRMASEFELANSHHSQDRRLEFKARQLGVWEIPAERAQALAAFQATFAPRTADQPGLAPNLLSDITATA